MSRIVLVTGANKGIGFGIVKGLLEQADEFSTIILTSRSEELGHQAIGQLNHNPKLVYHQLDVTDQSSINSCAEFVARTYGKIDVLVNNAGWAAKGSAFDYEIARTSIGINFYGLKHMTEAFINLINPGGQIVNISSSAGITSALKNSVLASRFLAPDLTHQGIIDLAEEFISYVRDGTWVSKGWPTFAYGVSKNLVNSYTRVLHKEFTENGVPIRVNAVHPGYVRTDMAGPNAELSVEEGCYLPIKCIRDTSISGKFWIKDKVTDFY